MLWIHLRVRERARGRWVLAGDRVELALTKNACGGTQCRIWAIVAAFEHGGLHPQDLGQFKRCLGDLVSGDVLRPASVPSHLGPALTKACADWTHERAQEWICWVMAERLAANLDTDKGPRAGFLCLTRYGRTDFSLELRVDDS